MRYLREHLKDNFIYLLLKRSALEHFDDSCPQLAAAISYYTLFALFPLVILSAGVFGLIQGSEEAQRSIVDLVTSNIALTEAGRESLEGTLRNVASSAGVFSIMGILGLVFSASGVMGAIRHAINSAFDIEQRRAVWHGKLVDICLVAMVGLVAGASLLVTLVHSLIPELGAGSEIIDLGFKAVPMLMNFLIFAFLFTALPALDIKIKDIWPGALVATLLYEATKAGFTFYVANFGNYGEVYGPAATIVAFLFFVFISANVFLLGAEVASEYPRLRKDRRRGTIVSAPKQSW